MVRFIVLFGLLASGSIDVTKAAECPGTSTVEMRECADKDLTEANRKLNETYTKLQAKVKDDDWKRLQEAQRAWIAFRDKECAYRVGRQEGTLWPVLNLRCLAEVTDSRAQELEKELSCPSYNQTGCEGQ